MNRAQRVLVLSFLVVLAMIFAFVFLRWGDGAFSSLGGDRIAILVVSQEDSESPFGNGYGLYTTLGITGLILGLILPLCLVAGAGYLALGAKWRE